ncbi:MAG: MFS transporter [Anaerolineae bacterium]|nr:MFS transporter [Gemmatimonadaceae bacterium]
MSRMSGDSATQASSGQAAKFRWRMLALLSVAELFGMAAWFAASAVSPQLADLWSLSASESGWLSTAVQIGFVAGSAVAALLNLPDILPSRWYFAGSSLLAAAANAGLVVADDYTAALLLRAVTGVCLAGVYPPAMKMISTWFERSRGLAIGTIIGALTVGKATPYLIHAIPGVSWQTIVLASSIGSTVAALLVAIGYYDGPVAFARRPFSWALAASVIRVREYRLVLGGYCGHMLELYAYWIWIPAFLAASAARQGVSNSAVWILAFSVIAIGAIGCVWGGAIADRIGHARLVVFALAISGSCALLTPLVFGRSLLLLAPVVLVWGMTVIADSAQFSTLVTRSVPAHAVGTALTLQTSIGFLLTTLSIQTVPPVVELVGWRYAFPVLAIGPALGIWSMMILKRVHEA